jgi:hypothetical protein
MPEPLTNKNRRAHQRQALKEAAAFPLLLLVIAVLTCDWNIWRYIDTLITLANAAYALAMLIAWLIRRRAGADSQAPTCLEPEAQTA